jgi:hypothetical protein
MKSKNDVLAALYTMGIIGFITLIITFKILVLWLLVGIAGFGCINITILLWDTIRYGLDAKDKKKREERLKEMMKKDEELRLYDLELDENDKAQIG